MLLSKEELRSMADRYQAKSDRAMEQYQESGDRKYYTTASNNEDLADALKAAANATDTIAAFGGLKSYLLVLAGKADDALHGDNVVRDTRITCQQVISIAKLYGYKPIEDISDD